MDELIPIVAMVFTLGPLAVLAVSYTPLGRALTTRLKGGDAGDIEEKLLAMKEELRRELLEDQAGQLEELHERLDFTERLLTDARRTPGDTTNVATPV